MNRLDVTTRPDIHLGQDLRSYWLDRARQHTGDSYAGVRLSKFPEDLRTYEHLLWLDKPDTVIEIGTQFGASALWLRDRLRTLADYGLIEAPRVISVDVSQAAARTNLPAVDPNYALTIHFDRGRRSRGGDERRGAVAGWQPMHGHRGFGACLRRT